MSVIVVLFVSAISLGVGLALLLVRRSREINPLPDSTTLEEEAARLARYRIIQLPSRAGSPERLQIRHQLIELRGKFMRLWRTCRLLAPYSDDPEFGTALITRFIHFHRLWLPLWIGTYGWVFEHAVQDVERLVESVELLWTSAHCVTVRAEGAAFESTIPD